MPMTKTDNVLFKIVDYSNKTYMFKNPTCDKYKNIVKRIEMTIPQHEFNKIEEIAKEREKKIREIIDKKHQTHIPLSINKMRENIKKLNSYSKINKDIKYTPLGDEEDIFNSIPKLNSKYIEMKNMKNLKNIYVHPQIKNIKDSIHIYKQPQTTVDDFLKEPSTYFSNIVQEYSNNMYYDNKIDNKPENEQDNSKYIKNPFFNDAFFNYYPKNKDKDKDK